MRAFTSVVKAKGGEQGKPGEGGFATSQHAQQQGGALSTAQHAQHAQQRPPSSTAQELMASVLARCAKRAEERAGAPSQKPQGPQASGSQQQAVGPHTGSHGTQVGAGGSQQVAVGMQARAHGMQARAGGLQAGASGSQAGLQGPAKGPALAPVIDLCTPPKPKTLPAEPRSPGKHALEPSKPQASTSKKAVEEVIELLDSD